MVGNEFSVEQEKILSESIRKDDVEALMKIINKQNVGYTFSGAHDITLKRKTSLLLGAECGSMKTVESLMREGASLKESVKIKLDSDKLFELNAVTLAAHFGHTNILGFFHKKYNVSFRPEDNFELCPANIAIRRDNANVVKFLIDEKIYKVNDRIRYTNTKYATILMCAAANGALKIVKMLIEEYKALIQPKDNDNIHIVWAALHSNFTSGILLLKFLFTLDPSLFEYIDDQGNILHKLVRIITEDPMIAQYIEYLLNVVGKEKLMQANNKGMYPLHVCVAFEKLTQEQAHSNLAMFEKLIQLGADPNAKTLKCGSTPLNIAVKFNQNHIVNYLIKLKCKIDEPNNAGVTPFLNAVSQGNLENVIQLLTAGANINIIPPGKHPNYDAYATACFYGKVNILKFFKERNYVFKSFNDPMMLALYAINGDHLDVVEYLLDEKKIKLDFIIPNDQSSSLHVAAENGSLKVFIALVQKYGFIIDKPNKNGLNCFHLAVLNGRNNIVEHLLSLNSRYIYDTHIDGSSMLHLTARSRQPHPETVKLLLANGANLEAEMHIAGMPHPKKPIDITTDPKCKNILEAAHQLMDLVCNQGAKGLSIKELLERGASLFQRDNQRRTLLHLAAEHDNFQTFETLLSQEKGPKLSALDLNNRTPMDLAKSKLHYPQFLLITFFHYVSLYRGSSKSLSKEELEQHFANTLKEISELPNHDNIISTMFILWERLKSMPDSPIDNINVILNRIFDTIKQSASKSDAYFKIGEKLKEYPKYGLMAYQALHLASTDSPNAKLAPKIHEYMADLLFSGRVHYENFKPMDMEADFTDFTSKANPSLVRGLDEDMELCEPIDSSEKKHKAEKMTVDKKGKSEKEEATSASIEKGLWHLLQAGHDKTITLERSRRMQRFIGFTNLETLGIDPCTTNGMMDLLKLFNSKQSKHELELAEKDKQIDKLNKDLAEKTNIIFKLNKKIGFIEGQQQMLQKLVSLNTMPPHMFQNNEESDSFSSNSTNSHNGSVTSPNSNSQTSRGTKRSHAQMVQADPALNSTSSSSVQTSSSGQSVVQTSGQAANQSMGLSGTSENGTNSSTTSKDLNEGDQPPAKKHKT